MIPKSLASVLRRVGLRKPFSLVAVLGAMLALCTPILALVSGAVLQCILQGTPDSDSSNVSSFAALLPDPSQLMPATSAPLARVVSLLGVAALVLLAGAILLYVFNRQLQIAAVAFETALFEKLRGHAKSLARVRTLSAQEQALTDSLNYHLPRARSSLGRWWRTYPRHGIQLAACVLLAVLLQPLLAILTIIATGLVVLVYRLLDRNRRMALPVVRERATQERDALVDLSLKGPLLESVHAEHEIERRFSEQLVMYRNDAIRSLTSSAWKVPTVIGIGGLLVCLFLFVVAVQILGSDSAFGLPGALAFTLCCVGAAVSAMQLQRAWRELKTVEPAAEELERFLALPVEKFDNDDLKLIERITSGAELEHVTVQDSRGRKLLENVSASFQPGKLIGVVSSQPLQARTLVELLMGLGRPVSGRMLVDGIVVTDLRPDSLSRCAHWVAADGALVTGTVRENLMGATKLEASADLNAVVAASRLKETVQLLPDDLATIITPDDDRLPMDAPFRLAVARAALRDASVLVIEEPAGNYDNETEQQTLDAIRSLVKDSAITVVLPQRLITLRNCDVVLMIHEHRIAEMGTHAELLQRNELYRHLNYIKYNPFRSK